MQTETIKRIIWFAVFMVWIGLVASMIHYSQMSEQFSSYEESNSSQSVPTGTEVSVQKTTLSEGARQNQSQQNSNIMNLQESKGQAQNDRKDLLVEYRVDRDKARSEQVNNYRELVNNPNTDPSIKKHAQEQMLAMTKRIEQEMEIESLIRAAGFSDAIAYLHENSIDLIVQSDGLTKEEVAKIGDIVIRVTDLRFEDISIIENRVSEN